MVYVQVFMFPELQSDCINVGTTAGFAWKAGFVWIFSVHCPENSETVKGTVSRDFSLLVFFINQFPPSYRVSH